MEVLLRRAGSYLLPHASLRTTSPPLPVPNGEGPTVVLAALPRSGTHLLIDLLVNNIPALRRRPLYVDWDAWCHGGPPDPSLPGVSGALVSAHHPFGPLDPTAVAALRAVASRALVVSPVRGLHAMLRSWETAGMGRSSEQAAQAMVAQHDEFWRPFAPLRVAFDDLLDREAGSAFVEEVGTALGTSGRAGKQLRLAAASRRGVLLNKVFTRVLGQRAPTINTTIGFKLK